MSDAVATEQALGLNNCDREPIHIIGRVQTFGVLVAIKDDWEITHASENLPDVFGEAAVDVIGLPLAELMSEDTIAILRRRIAGLVFPDVVERTFGLRTRPDGPVCDVAMHRHGNGIILEFEPTDDHPVLDVAGLVQPLIRQLEAESTVDALCAVAAEQVRTLTGMDRVKVYRFNRDDSGSVIAEARADGINSFLGLTYPASDIPKQVRALLKANSLRFLHDVNDPGSPILSADQSLPPLDLSFSAIRAHSPVHLEYLQNMGVAGTVTISILVRGRLWGLFACHHMQPKLAPSWLRTVLELFGTMFGYLLGQRLEDAQRAEVAHALLLRDRVKLQLAETKTLTNSLVAISKTLQDAIPHDGAIGWFDGKFQNTGLTPTEQEFAAFLPFLEAHMQGSSFSCTNMTSVDPAAQAYVDRAAGLLALRMGGNPGDLLVLYRREISKRVTWGGQPTKEIVRGQFGPRLTPRKSFEAWQETVRDTCEAWTEAQLNAADTLRMTLAEATLPPVDSSVTRADALQRQEVLIAELNHRIRNILTLIRSLVGQTVRGHQDIAAFTEAIGGRIHALALAHDQVSSPDSAAGSLRRLLETEAAPYLQDDGGNIDIVGPDVVLKKGALTGVALVAHEIISNSVKYGALSVAAGKVSVDLTKEDDGGVSIFWQERGGPKVTQPKHRGFGTTLIENAIPHEFLGSVDLQFHEAGVEIAINLPGTIVESVIASDQDVDAAKHGPVLSVRRVPKRVLLLQDNVIISLDTKAVMTRLGVPEVSIVSRLETAMEAIVEGNFDFALIDLGLGVGLVEPAAEALITAGTPFAFMTGYGSDPDVGQKFVGVPVLMKPFDELSLFRVLAGGAV